MASLCLVQRPWMQRIERGRQKQAKVALPPWEAGRAKA